MKTNKKDFKYFKSRCEYWKIKFNIGHWDIKYEHKDLGNTCYAQNQTYFESFMTIIKLNIDWTNMGDREKNNQELDNTAKHEVLHILAKFPEEELVVRLTRLLK